MSFVLCLMVYVWSDFVFDVCMFVCFFYILLFTYHDVGSFWKVLGGFIGVRGRVHDHSRS